VVPATASHREFELLTAISSLPATIVAEVKNVVPKMEPTPSISIINVGLVNSALKSERVNSMQIEKHSNNRDAQSSSGKAQPQPSPGDQKVEELSRFQDDGGGSNANGKPKHKPKNRGSSRN
jgi:hypothetical protein